MTSTAQYKCANCKAPFTARTADRARGWARFCSKSCKASRQEKRTGQFSALLHRGHCGRSRSTHDEGFEDDGSWDAHKGQF